MYDLLENIGKEVLVRNKAKNDIRTITVKIRKKGDLTMEKSPTKETKVSKRTSPIAEENRVLHEEREKGAAVHTPRGNGKEAAVEVPVTVGVEVAARARRGKTRLLPVCEIERKRER